MLTICKDEMCAGCMACVDICPAEAVSIELGFASYRPVIDSEKCVDCGRCVRICQQLHPAEMREPIIWRQGWAEDQIERRTSSSGGIASAVLRAFAALGGAVCSCTFVDGRFCFKIAEAPEEIKRFKGSKYVKSNPSGAYRRVGKMLKSGRRVLFAGLPCQVSAMRNFVGEELEKELYTVDLICHGTPSIQILELFLREQGYQLDELTDITFRRKAKLQLRAEGVPVGEPGVIDRYLIAFLNGLDYTENCYSCAYARCERVSDLTLGDSWGTELVDETTDGVSLVLCQTEKGEELLRMAKLELLPVDSERAVANNAQLKHPMERPGAREDFLQDLISGISFERAVRQALPKQCLKQDIKRILKCLGLWKPSGGGYLMTLYQVPRKSERKGCSQ